MSERDESFFKPPPTSPYSLAKAFQRNCNIKLTPDDEAELQRLFQICRDFPKERAKAKGEEND